MIDSSECPNHEINIEMCPCTEMDCPRRGICCECITYHRNSTQWPLTACMRSGRPAATLDLPKDSGVRCANYERNKANCPCTSDKCERPGNCCDCIRNHWTEDGTGRPACFRQAS